MADERLPAPFRLRGARAAPAGFPPDVLPNQVITAAHINAIRDSVYAWPGDVDGQNHVLRNVTLENALGVLADPTTTAGDLIARGASAIGRVPIGAAGQVLTVDLAAPAKVKWAAPVAAPVASVFGRSGAIVAQAGDYTAAQVTGALADPLTTKGDLVGRTAAATVRIPAGLDGQVLKASAAASAGLVWAGESVPSVFGRSGAIAAQAGDYTAAQITNAVSSIGSYPDPAWLTSLSWSKLIGTPASFPPAAHTHTPAEIVGPGTIAPARLGTGTADASVYLRGDGIWAPAAGGSGGGAVTSVFGRAGVVVAQAGDYTAAQVTGAVADPTVTKGDLIVRNDLNSLVRLPAGASGQVLQADSAVTVGMKWTTITGAIQTPWVSDIDAATFKLTNVSRIGVAKTLPAYPLDVTGDINFTGTLRQNGVAVSFSGSQTPWTSDVDGAGFMLKSAGRIGIGNDATVLPSAATDPACIVGSRTAGLLGRITVCANVASTASPVGTFAFANYAITATDKRIAQIYAYTDGAIDQGAIVFGTTFLNVLNERMRLTAAGNLGINTQVAPISVAAAGAQYLTVRGSTAFGVLELATAAGDADGTPLGLIAFTDPANNQTDTKLVQIAALRSGGTANNRGSVLVFHTRANGATGTAERMRIDNAGNVGIGTTGPNDKLTVAFGANVPDLATFNGGLLLQGSQGVDLELGASNASPFGVWLQGRSHTPAAAYPIVLNPLGGNVGVGISSPVKRLQVNTASGINLGISTGPTASSAICIEAINDAGTANTNMELRSLNFLFAIGNVAIGRSTASGYPLDVVGDINCTGAFRNNGAVIGQVTLQNVLTGSRALGTVYQNTAGKPVFITVTVSITSSGAFSAYTDASNPPTTVVATQGSTTVTTSGTLSFWVMTGNFYKVAFGVGAGTLATWVEWY